MQRARKYLGYGFGPKEGDHFVVEEIADVDDDEEDYGQYQEERLRTVASESSFWDFDKEFWDDGRFNEYACARRVKDYRKHN